MFLIIKVTNDVEVKLPVVFSSVVVKGGDKEVHYYVSHEFLPAVCYQTIGQQVKCFWHNKSLHKTQHIGSW